jgi:hypothetical protein
MEFSIGEESPVGITIENLLNREGDILPFGLFKPELEGKLTWMCNYGTEGDIISVFSMILEDKKNERDVKILKDMVEAKYMRDELIKDGWRPLVPPEIKFTVSSNEPKPPNRKERREIEKKLKKR